MRAFAGSWPKRKQLHVEDPFDRFSPGYRSTVPGGGGTSQWNDLFSLRPFLREQANVVPFPIGPQLDAASLWVYFGSGPPACNPQSFRFESRKN